MLDVFNSDVFSIVSLTDAINKMKFKPGRIGAMGLFNETSIATTTVAIEEKDGILSLVAPTPRGAPGNTIDKGKRAMRNLSVPHFELNGAVMAEEVQNIRPFGNETGLDTVQARVMEHMADMTASLDVTLEHARMGAIIGVVTYADSSTLNLFTEFGVSQEAEIDFDLDNANPASGALRKACAGVVRKVATVLDGVPFTGLRAFCGDNFFDDLIAHPEVRATYDGWTEAKILREGYIEANGQSYGAFEFGGIVWENYRGATGGSAFVNTDKCHIFPMGVQNLFRTYYAPADWNEAVNTLGRPRYAKMREMLTGKGWHLDTQMNALNICTRPKSLIKGKRT